MSIIYDKFEQNETRLIIIESIHFEFDDKNSLLKHKSSFDKSKKKKNSMDNFLDRFNQSTFCNGENGTCLQEKQMS